MFTEDGKWMSMIDEKITNRQIRAALFQALINYRIYQKAEIEIGENMRLLNYYNFRASQTCHMTDGLFGGIEYAENKITYTIKVTGNLITLITSAHRLLTCIEKSSKNPDNITNGLNWKSLSTKKCSKVFDNRLRNYMEHLEESVFTEGFDRINCQFSPSRILYYSYLDKQNNKLVKVKREFDFTQESLSMIDTLMDELYKMLSDVKTHDSWYNELISDSSSHIKTVYI